MGAGKSQPRSASRGYEEDLQDPAQVRDYFASMVSGSRSPAARTQLPPASPALAQGPDVATKSLWERMAGSGRAPPAHQFHSSMLPARQAPAEPVSPEKTRRESTGLTMLRLFPAAFSFCVFLVFAYPVLATLCLALDSTVQYWIGSYGKLAILIPLIFLVTHVVHSTTQVPSKPAVLFCVLVPSLFLLVLADVVLSNSIEMSGALLSSNCDEFDGKNHLQSEWETGYSIYQSCLAATVAKYPNLTNFTLASAFENYKFQECEEYEGAYQSHKPAWDYLRSLEQEHGCAGWCSVNVTLWSFKEPKDSCSVAASDVFQVKIRRVALHIVIYVIAILVLGCVGIIRIGAILRAKGLKW